MMPKTTTATHVPIVAAIKSLNKPGLNAASVDSHPLCLQKLHLNLSGFETRAPRVRILLKGTWSIVSSSPYSILFFISLPDVG